MKRLKQVGILAAGMAVASLGVTAEVTVAETDEQVRMAVDARQSVMKLVGWNMGPLGGMLRNPDTFDAEVAERSATRINDLSRMVVDAFSVDTSGSDADTESLPGIWDGWSDFQDKAQALVDTSGALAEVAATGDQGDTLGAIGRMGQACGGCHDDYRED